MFKTESCPELYAIGTFLTLTMTLKTPQSQNPKFKSMHWRRNALSIASKEQLVVRIISTICVQSN